MTVLYSNDFESGDSNPAAGWTTLDGSGMQVFKASVVSLVAPRGTRVIGRNAVGDAATCDAVASPIENQAMRIACRVNDIANLRIAGPILRVQSKFKHYRFLLESDGANVTGRIVKYDSGSYPLATSAAVAAATGDVIHIEVYAIGSALSMYFWKAEQSKPETPNVSATDTAYPTGLVGLMKFGASGVYGVADDVVITDSAGGEDFFYAPDTTPPTLSAPSAIQTGPSTATVGATTDEGNGTLYVVVTLASTQPSVAQIKAGQNSSGTAAVFATSATVNSTGAKTFGITGLTASTTYYAHLVHTDAAGNDSNRVTSSSFTTSAADTTPPVLTNPVGTATGTTTATTGATTDEGNGTLYAVVTLLATPPTAIQIKAGQNSSGTSAAFAGSVSINSGGAKTIGATGLTASTLYYAHLVHTDASGNNSNIVSSSSFTTSAAGDTTPPNLSSPVGTATGPSTATVGATTDEGSGIMYAVVTSSATPPSAAQVLAGQTNTGASASWGDNITVSSIGAKTLSATGLAPSTTYYAYVMHRDAAGNNSAVAASSSFTTSAAPAGRITTPPLKNNTGTLLANISGWTVNVFNSTTGAFVVQKTGLSTDSSGVITFTDAAVVTGTTYAYECAHDTYGRRCPTALAS